ncbi:cytochrome P450 [Nocardia carnea]|uniref:Cytochrome P450 n=1 Tax=Nocardia carnea TaxID=37328 RepID=A0ABW7TQL2_9NOCA|nr:cytochrome P450 [Nocardia carnea]
MISTQAFDVFDPGYLDNPYPLYRLLREQAPVYRVPGTDFFLVTSSKLLVEAAARTEEFSSNLTAVLVREPNGSASTFDIDAAGQAVHVLATADDPVHAAHRKLVGPALAGRIRTLGGTVDTLVDRLWRQEVHAGHIDWATGMADRLPLAVVAGIIGLPEADHPQLLRWAYDSTEMLGGVVSAERLPQLMTSAAELAGYLHTAFAAAKARSGPHDDDLLGVLAAAARADRIEDHVAVLILVQLVGAGGESTAGLIANAARILAEDLDLQQQLREQPRLVPAFLDETLRFESPFRGHHRHVTTDTELGGVELPADSHLLLLWGAANRDPAVYSDPDTLDLHRTDHRSHLAFGRGAHYCIGSALAKLEATAAVTALLDNTRRFALVESSPPQWLLSLFARRHRTLPLQIDCGPADRVDA